MARYHLKADGNPALCRANEGACPKGGEHFPSEVEARAGYEVAMGRAFEDPQSLYAVVQEPTLFAGLAGGLAETVALESARVEAHASIHAGQDRLMVIHSFKNALKPIQESLAARLAASQDERAKMAFHLKTQEDKLETWELSPDEQREQNSLVHDIGREVSSLGVEASEIQRAIDAVQSLEARSDGAIPPGMHQCPGCGVIISGEAESCGRGECVNNMEHMMHMEHEQWLQDNRSWYRD